MYHLVFLKEPNNVRFRSRLYIVLVVAGLWVVNFLFWLYLADCVQIIKLTHYELLLPLLPFNQDAKEVRPLGCVEKNWCVVHFVF